MQTAEPASVRVGSRSRGITTRPRGLVSFQLALTLGACAAPAFGPAAVGAAAGAWSSPLAAAAETDPPGQAAEDDPGAIARQRLQEGEAAFGRGAHAAALEAFEAARRLGVAQHDLAVQLAACNGLGKVRVETGDLTKALGDFEASLALSRERADPRAEARSLYNLGETLRRQGQLQAASVRFAASLALEEAHGTPEDAVETRLGLANIDLELGRTDEALAGFEAALAFYHNRPDAAGEALVLGNLGVLAEMTGRFGDALRLHEESLRLKERLGDRPGIALTLGNVGVVWLLVGDPEQALDWFQRSLAAARAIPDAVTEARAHSNLGAARLQLGRFRPAAQALERALDHYRRLGDDVSVAEVLGNFAALRKAVGDYAGAADDFRTLLETFRAQGRRPDEAVTLLNLGAVEELLGHRTDALAHLEASLALRRELTDRFGEALTLNNLAEVRLRAGQPDAAQALYESALELARDLGARTELTRALLGLGDVAAARDRIGEAQRLFEEASRTATTSGDFEARVGAFQKLANVCRRQGNWAAAIDAYRQALREIETAFGELGAPAQQVAFLDLHSPVYHQLASCFAQAGRPDEALRTLEAGRARALEQALRSGGGWFQGRLDPETARQLRSLESRARVAQCEVRTLAAESSPKPGSLDAARERLARARGELLRFEERLQNRLADPVALATRWTEVPEQPVVPVAGTESVLFVEYLVGEERSYVFSFRGRPPSEAGASAREQRVSVNAIEATASELETAVSTFRHRLDIRYPRLPIPEGTRLHQWLIAPLRDHLRAGDLLCVIPDGALWELPFQALSGPEGRYLIADHAIAYAPSWHGLVAIRTWADRRRSRATASTSEPPLELDLLAMANPALGPTRPALLPLLGAPVAIPGTEAQARRIVELFQPRSRLYVGAEATEARVRALAGRARILHLATHGVFEPADPMFSGLLLTPGPEDDGYWDAREILQTDLRADLVVLSACESGRGRIRRGEGLWGLAWALFVAGSPAHVLSQWAVADESTAALMTAFYQHLQGKEGAGLHKAEALRQAQLELLEGRVGPAGQYTHPFYWAPFVLMGDWR